MCVFGTPPEAQTLLTKQRPGVSPKSQTPRSWHIETERAPGRGRRRNSFVGRLPLNLLLCFYSQYGASSARDAFTAHYV